MNSFKQPSAVVNKHLRAYRYIPTGQWHKSNRDNWYARYYKLHTGYLGRKKLYKHFLITAAIVTGQWIIEVLDSRDMFYITDKKLKL